MIDTEVKPIHTEIAKHIKKETGKSVRPESVALVLEGNRDYRAGEKARAEQRRIERKEAKIADLKAKLAALTGEESEPEAAPAAPKAPARGAAKKAATPAPKKAAEPKSEPEVVTPIKKAKKKAEPVAEPDDYEGGIEDTPEGGLPIEVIESDDSFEVADEDEEDDDWDVDDDEDDDEGVEDF